MQAEQTLEQELQSAKRKTAKPMLWISIISMIMFFAGLTSAYVISMKREDWVSFDLPQAFYVSTFLIVASSITLILSQRFLKKDNRQLSIVFLLATFLFGIAFIWQQYDGFNQLKSVGLFFLLILAFVILLFSLKVNFLWIIISTSVFMPFLILAKALFQNNDS